MERSFSLTIKNDIKATDLHLYAYKNDIDKVTKILQDSANDVNTRDSKGRTPLFLASSFGRHEIAEMMLKRNTCNPDIADNKENTPLHEAVEKGDLDMVKLLINSGTCDISKANSNHQSPLMRAAYYDYVEIVRILHKNGTDLNELDGTCLSPLLLALNEGSTNVVEYVIRNGCDVNVVDREGHSALYHAIFSPCINSINIAKILVNNGYDIDKDRYWLSMVDKPSRFYQDDDFYDDILRTLNISNNNSNLDRQYTDSNMYFLNKRRKSSSPSFALRLDEKNNNNILVCTHL